MPFPFPNCQLSTINYQLKKGLYACKPDPVLPRGSLYHLSAMLIAQHL